MTPASESLICVNVTDNLNSEFYYHNYIHPVVNVQYWCTILNEVPEEYKIYIGDHVIDMK